MTKPRLRVDTNGKLRGAVIHGEVIDPTKRPTVEYMNGSRNGPFMAWGPGLRDHQEDVSASYVDAASRAIDMMQNQGWIAGAIDQSIASMIGDEGLRMGSRPDRVALGWDPEKAEAWSEIVERRWIAWSTNPMECDAAGKMTVSQMQDAVVRRYYSHGEGLSLLPYVTRAETSPGTKVQLLPPHRLVQDSMPGSRMSQGVTTDRYGLPIGYRIKTKGNAQNWVDLRARDAAGRPQVIHIFEGGEGQMRGITPLVPILKRLKQYDELAEVTLRAAIVQSIFAATVEGDAPTEEVMRSLQTEAEQDAESGELLIDGATFGQGSIGDYIGAAAAWYQNARIDLSGEGGRITHMFPGHKLTFNRSEHPNSNYEDYAKFLLREIARCLGMTFETLTGDFSGATYSSVRMATSEIWPVITRRRRNIPARFSQYVFEAWLEEEIENGTIPFDGGVMGFFANRAAAVGTQWYGPAKPQADDLKTAKAYQIYKSMGVYSDERIASEQGFDITDEYERRAREMKLRQRLGLPEGDTMLPPPDEADDVDPPVGPPARKKAKV